MALTLCEEFVSIQGEGRKSGQLSYFVRLAGCNLKCSFCDEPNHTNSKKYYKILEDDLFRKILNSQVKHVVITGGEPTMQKGIDLLIRKLHSYDLEVSVETNGFDLDLVYEADLITWSPKYNFEEAFLNKAEIALAKKPETLINADLDIKIPWPSSIPEDKLFGYIKFLGDFVAGNAADIKVWLTPINDGLNIDVHNVKSAWDIIYNERVAKLNDRVVQLNLNTQVHKFLNLR